MSRTAVMLGLTWLLVASASAQIIEVERDFRFLDGYPDESRHTVSLPDPLFVPDQANSLGTDPCDLSELPPDGVVNADDLICLLWSDEPGYGRPVGGFAISRIDPETCRFVTRSAYWGSREREPIFVGTNFAYSPTVGYVIQRAGDSYLGDGHNRVTLRSRCGIRLPAREIDGGCPSVMLALPYDSPYEHADEVLCGREGVDFERDDEGRPDRCTEGLFDPISGARVSVDSVGPVGPGYRGLSVEALGGAPFFIGGNYDLLPGRSYELTTREGHGGRRWEPPGGSCFRLRHDLDPVLND